MVGELQLGIHSLLSQFVGANLGALRLLEIGCGSGGNLAYFIKLGFKPENLVGNDLLNWRLDHARTVLPGDLVLIEGDASVLQLPDASFDVVVQATVFSSILNWSLQTAVATKIWNLCKPGGAVLWYDLAYRNPSNPDVVAMTKSKIRSLFPDATITYRRITLAPPIARIICDRAPWLYGPLSSLPFLRTHLLCWIAKPLNYDLDTA